MTEKYQHEATADRIEQGLYRLFIRQLETATMDGLKAMLDQKLEARDDLILGFQRSLAFLEGEIEDVKRHMNRRAVTLQFPGKAQGPGKEKIFPIGLSAKKKEKG